MTMFSTPAEPSASNFAPGFVITSMFFTIEAGIARKICDGLLLNITFGLPFTYTLNELLPFTVMLS